MKGVDLMSYFGTMNRIMSKAKLTKTLPTDRIGFEKQQSVIKGYIAAFEKAGNVPITNADVAPLVEMKASSVGLMNAFFLDVGFISRSESGKYAPTSDLLSFAKTMQFDPTKAWPKLAPLLSKTWFAKEIIARAKMQELEESEALICLAECSNAEAHQTAQLKILLDYLSLVRLVTRNGSKIKLGTQEAQADSGTKQEKPPLDPPKPPTAPAPSSNMRELLLAKFPQFDPAWPDELKAKWFDGFEKLMKSAEDPK